MLFLSFSPLKLKASCDSEGRNYLDCNVFDLKVSSCYVLVYDCYVLAN